MPRGMTAVAQCDQIRRFIRASSGTRNQMMNVRFPCEAELTAFLTTPVVAREHDGPHRTPMLANRCGA
jgi:hypothetical protein